MANKLLSFLKSHPIITTAPPRRALEKKIEQALMKRFPGLKLKFTIEVDGDFSYKLLPGSKQRFDELYPGMTRKQADAQILVDIKAVILEHMPDAHFIDYERYGNITQF